MASYQLMNTFMDRERMLQTRDKALERSANKNLSIVDAGIDDLWAQMQVDSRAPKSYFDYYYAGEDIRVYLAETSDHEEFGDLPIHGLGFNVSQEKMPVYGYWSYTYDAMLRGTRIISGTFILISKRPNYMKELLAVAARNRSENRHNLQDDYASPWRQDEENYERYWGRHLDASAIKQNGTEWSIHPPFSLVVVYGVQGTSVDVKNVNSFNAYSEDNALMYDHNQRLIEDGTRHSSRIILDACELVDVERSFAPGQLVAERYSFLARDIFVPESDSVRSNTVRASEVPDAYGNIQQ